VTPPTVEVAAARAAGLRSVPRVLARLSPKHLILVLITLILVVGELSYHILGGYERLAAALLGCLATEAALSLWVVGRWPLLQSAYVSGISLSLLLKPQPGLLWPFVVGALLSIGSKYVLRYRGRHLWNPTNFGVCALLLLAPAKVAILSHEWGNALGTNLVIWSVGLLIAARARILHVTLTYAACFLALGPLRAAIAGTPLLAEVAPITGPMYQLFVFFMITDPRTTVGSRSGRMAVAATIALVETGLRIGNDLHVPLVAPLAPAPALFALFLVGPIAMAYDLRRRARSQAPPAPAGVPAA
jgi:hypothetical protein